MSTALQTPDSPTPDPATVLKRDGLGRVRTPKDKREALLDEFERSGLGGTAFARLAGVHYQTFAGWMQQRRRARGQERTTRLRPKRGQAALPAPRQVRLVEAVMAQIPRHAPAGSALRVELPGGACFAVGDVAQVRLAAALLKALEGARSC